MAGLQTGTTFVDGNSYVAADLNAIVNNAVPLPTLITQWSQKTSPTTSDKFLLSDASNSGALVFTTLGNISTGLGVTKISYALTETGVANAYVIAGIPTVTAMTSSQIIIFQPTNINTGASTLKVDATSAYSIYNKGVALTGGELIPSNYVMLMFDGTQFDLLSTTPVMVGDNGTLGSGIQGICSAPPQNSLAKGMYWSAGATWAVPEIVKPCGRLTLTSNTPVLTANTTAQSTVYYTAYNGNLIPIYDGTNWCNYTFSSATPPQISLGLDNNSGHTGYQQSGKVFDLFVFNNAGTITLGTGPAWTSSTARGTGAGTTQLTMLNGIWTNTVSISLKIDATASQVTGVAANTATYVGTMYATANGQTGIAFKANASGGGNNIAGLYNAYNRVKTTIESSDSTASWTYASATWRQTNANASNRISFVDGLQQSFIETSFNQTADGATSSSNCNIGVNLDATTGGPGKTSCFSGIKAESCSRESFAPQLGFHFIQCMEAGGGGTLTLYGSGSLGTAVPTISNSSLMVVLEM